MSAPMDKVTEAARGVVDRLQQAVAGAPTPEDPQARTRWRSVTINRSQEEAVPGGRLPGPLAALGDAVDVETRPAPGGRGTELAARLREPGSGPSHGDDLLEQVRSALREAKQLIEVGEVLRVDPQPHGRRPATPTGKVVDSASGHASGEGVR